MTPERKKWWDSLPQGERELREAIANHEKWIKINKSYLPDGTTDIEYLKKMLRRHKLITKALKHELERGGSAEIRQMEAEALGSKLYFCGDCKIALYIGENPPSYKFCPYCGKKLKEKVKSDTKVEEN